MLCSFRSGALNLLVATSVGSEGMDFRQCQLVVAFDCPVSAHSLSTILNHALRRIKSTKSNINIVSVVNMTRACQQCSQYIFDEFEIPG